MRVPLPFVAAILLAFCAWSAPDMAGAQSRAQRTDALRDHGLDPASSLESRVKETPATVLKMFTDAGQATPTAHALTAMERRKLSNAFAALPSLHRRILGERLRSVSFLDGMPNTALTSTVNPGEPYHLFDITIRAGVLGEDVSGFLTQKERSCFEIAGSSLSVSIEAGTLDAVVYVLLHEATHVVDASLRITPAVRPGDEPADGPPASSFTEGVWSDRTTVAPRYRDQILERVRFRAGGEILPVDRAEAVYAALRRTPFVSLYGSTNWHDDLAEAVTWYHLTERLEQPYRIVIRRAGRETFAYEPMKSPIVRSRFDQMDRFYEDAPTWTTTGRPCSNTVRRAVRSRLTRYVTVPRRGGRAASGSWSAAGLSRRMEFMAEELPCLDLLESTPDILRGLMAGISEEDARWKPAEDRFSIAEVLAHLSHSEGHCYRARVDLFLREELPEFEPDDAQMYLELYRNADPKEDFRHFDEQRETNVALLRGLPAEAGDRKATHREAGEITLSQMLHEWALHDLGHIRQIAELVRARKYLAGAGPLGASYQLKP